MIKPLALGVDIGGTNTVFGVVDKDGNVLFEEGLSTKAFSEASEMIDAIYEKLPSEYRSSIQGIGIGAPNGNVFTGNIEFAPNLLWKGVVPIVSLFENRFGKPAVLANDANAAAVGEHLFGNARDLKDFVTITLGTGLGSGIFIDGSLVLGHHGFAGEYGHIRVINNGRLCGCGRHGCLETYASSTGVKRSIIELESAHKANSVVTSDFSARKVFEAAQSGDLFAAEIVEYTAEILGSALADFAAFSNPKAYVLFGGLAQSGDYFAQKVKLHLERNALQIFKNDIEVRVSSLHDKNAAVIGTAASLFWMLEKRSFV